MYVLNKVICVNGVNLSHNFSFSSNRHDAMNVNSGDIMEATCNILLSSGFGE